MASVELIKAVAVTSELCGRTFSPEAAEVFVSDLEGYPEDQVFSALVRCRREVRGLLTVQDVVSRLDDGRPGVDEAWAMLPFDEATTVVWTDEMVEAWSVAMPLLEEGERIAARMAFKEAYAKAVSQAREQRQPVRWSASLGHDARGREAVLLDAVHKGRLSLEYAQKIAPQITVTPKELLGLAAQAPDADAAKRAVVALLGRVKV